MERVIRVIGEREEKAAAFLKKELETAEEKALRIHSVRPPLISGIFFAVLSPSVLGSYDMRSGAVILSEKLLGYDNDTLRAVFLHECAHAIDHRKNGTLSGHSPLFRSYCLSLGVPEGFDKAKVSNAMEEKEKRRNRIEKLLALSSSPFEAEAVTALSKARELIAAAGCGERAADDEKIYWTDLFQGGRIPGYAQRYAILVSSLTGAFVVKTGTGDGGKRALRAFGNLEQTEAALYIFSRLVEASEGEVTALRRKGEKITMDSFAIGAVEELEKKLCLHGGRGGKEIEAVRNGNMALAKKYAFPSSYFARTAIRTTADASSVRAGMEFGKRTDISRNVGQREIE